MFSPQTQGYMNMHMKCHFQNYPIELSGQPCSDSWQEQKINPQYANIFVSFLTQNFQACKK